MSLCDADRKLAQKNVQWRIFPIYNPGQKSLGQNCNIRFFSVISRFLGASFWKSSHSSPSLHPIQRLNSRKKFRIHMSNIVYGVRGGVGPVSIGKRLRNAKVSQDVSMIVDSYF